MPLTAGAPALATLRTVAIAKRRLTLVSILTADPLLTPILALHAVAWTILTGALLTLAIDLLAVLFVLLVGAIGAVARMRRGE